MLAEKARSTLKWPWEGLPDDFPGDVSSTLQEVWSTSLESIGEMAQLAIATDRRLVGCNGSSLICYDMDGHEVLYIDGSGINTSDSEFSRCDFCFAPDGRLALGMVKERTAKSATEVAALGEAELVFAVYDLAYVKLWERTRPLIDGQFQQKGSVVLRMFAVNDRFACAISYQGHFDLFHYSAGGEEANSIRIDEPNVKALAFAAEGWVLVGAASGWSLTLYDTSGGRLWRHPELVGDRVVVAAFGPDGGLVSGSIHSTLTFWSSAGSRTSHVADVFQKTVRDPGAAVVQLVFLEDGRLVVGGGRAWTTATDGQRARKEGDACSIIISPYLVAIAFFSLGGQKLWLCDISAHLTPTSFTSTVSLSANCYLAIARRRPSDSESEDDTMDFDGDSMTLYSLRSFGRLSRVSWDSSKGPVSCIAVAIDGRVARVLKNNCVELYTASGEQLGYDESCANRWVTGTHHIVNFSPNGNLIVIDNVKGCVYDNMCNKLRELDIMWGPEPDRTAFVFQRVSSWQASDFKILALAEDGRFAAVYNAWCSRSHGIVIGYDLGVWDVEGKRILKQNVLSNRLPSEHGYGVEKLVTALSFVRTGKIVYAIRYRTALPYESVAKEVESISRTEQGNEPSLAPTAHWLVVYDIEKKTQELIPVGQEVISLINTRRSKEEAFVCGSADGSIALYAPDPFCSTPRHEFAFHQPMQVGGSRKRTLVLARMGDHRFASADSAFVSIWCWEPSGLHRVALFPIAPEAKPEAPSLCISCLEAGSNARLAVATPNHYLAFSIGQTEAYPLALLWKQVTYCIAGGKSGGELFEFSRELFECCPSLLAQPVPGVQYTLLHWFIRKGETEIVKMLCELCIAKEIWGGLESSVDGNLLDFAMQTNDHDMIRAVLDYLSRTPVWGLLMRHWTGSLRKLVVDFGPDAFVLGLGELFESRLVLPSLSGGVDGPEQLPTCARCGALRVVGSQFTSLGQTHYRNSIAQEGGTHRFCLFAGRTTTTPISLRALFLLDFQQVWEKIAELPSVPDAVIVSTVYRASLQHSWQSYGWLANVRIGIFLFVDVIFFSFFAVVTAEHASISVVADQPQPMLSAPRVTVARTFVATLLVLQASWPLLLQLLRVIYQRCHCNQLRIRVASRRCSCVISRCRCCCCRRRCALHCEWLGWQRYLDLCETPFSFLRVLLAAGVLLSWWHPLWLVPVSGLRAIQWEVRALLRQGWSRYWHDAWNFLDWIALLLCTGLPALVLLEIMTPKTSTPLLSITILLLWIRFIYVLRASRSFGHLIQMIQATTIAMGPFMMLMFIVLVGLSCGWAVLAIANPGEHFLQEEDSIHCEPTDGASDDSSISCGSVAQTFHHAVWQWFASFTLMYRLTVLGDFPGDAFALADFSGNPDDSPQLETAWIAWFFFGFGTLFFLVLLLNLLIAIIGDKYDEMQLKAEPEFLRQRSRICLEAYALELHPRPMQEPYLVMSFPKKFELHSEIGGMKPDLEDEWEGRCKAFERMFLRQESDLRQVIENKDLASEKQIAHLIKQIYDKDLASKEQIARLQHVQTEELAHLTKQSEQIARLQHVQSEQMDHLLKQSEKINALEGLIREQGVRCDDRLGEQFKIISSQGQAFDRLRFSMEEIVAARWPRIGDDSAELSCARRQRSSQGGIGTERSHQQHTMMHTSLPDAPSDSRTGLLTHHVQMSASDSGSDASYANGEPPPAPSTNVPRRRQVNDNSSVLRQQSCDACVRPPTSSGSMPRKEHGAHRRRRSQLPIQMRSSADLQEAGR